MHTVGNGKKVAFPSPAPISRLFNIQLQVFQGVLPDGMGQFFREGQTMPRRVVFENLAFNDDPDTTFLDEVCQEIGSLMKAPVSYPRVLFHLSILYQQAGLAQKPVDDPRWRAMFQCHQIENT
jgi:hypothetical protein